MYFLFQGDRNKSFLAGSRVSKHFRSFKSDTTRSELWFWKIESTHASYLANHMSEEPINNRIEPLIGYNSKSGFWKMSKLIQLNQKNSKADNWQLGKLSARYVVKVWDGRDGLPLIIGSKGLQRYHRSLFQSIMKESYSRAWDEEMDYNLSLVLIDG